MNFLDLDGNLFPPEKIFCPNTGDEKNEMMKFFPKSGNFSLKIIFKANFFFSREIYFQISSPDFGKPQKFHDFVFISPEF